MVVIIVQARMRSTRLPGKVLKPIAGRPMLSYQVERLARVRRVDRIVVATTVRDVDTEIVQFCGEQQIPCVRGSEDDVLSRFCAAAQAHQASIIVRVTADCPLIEPELIDTAIEMFVDSASRYDCVSNMIEPSWPYGMAVEVVSAAALNEANAESVDPAEREHVTPFIYWRPQRYRIGSLTRQPDLSQHRWTVDTEEDFELVSRIISTLYPRQARFGIGDVLALLAENPSWSQLNAHIQQRTATPDKRV